MNQAQEDGYVECSECGHPIEKHDEAGLDVPGVEPGSSVRHCTVGWTKTAIMAYRREQGLPGRFDRSTL